jgi:hypothetical protein
MATFIRLHFALHSDDSGEIKYKERLVNVDKLVFIEDSEGGGLIFLTAINMEPGSTIAYTVKETVHEMKMLLALEKKHAD